MSELLRRGQAAASRGRLPFVAVLLLVTALTLHAQAPHSAPLIRPQAVDSSEAVADTLRPNTGQLRSVTGRVMRPVGNARRGAAGVWVVLHRVGSDTAAPLDSVRSGANGGYTFRYRATGDPDAIYFVSADYAGIAYFSSPLRHAEVSGDDAEITVFDTTSGSVPLHVRGRHVVISSPRADGTREVVEVYELSNDSTVTVISPDGIRPTWIAHLPPGATEFRPGQSDISADAIRADDGRAAVVAPFAPGLKQLSFAFRVPSSTFPVSIPLEYATATFEVLVEEPTARVAGAGLSEVSPVSVEGRTFRRFLAQNVPASAVMHLDVPAVTTLQGRPLFLAIVTIAIGAAMLVALAATFTRRTRRSAVPAISGLPVADDPDRLARAIAELDESFGSVVVREEAERAVYESRRTALKQRLAAALDARRAGK